MVRGITWACLATVDTDFRSVEESFPLWRSRDAKVSRLCSLARFAPEQQLTKENVSLMEKTWSQRACRKSPRNAVEFHEQCQMLHVTAGVGAKPCRGTNTHSRSGGATRRGVLSVPCQKAQRGEGHPKLQTPLPSGATSCIARQRPVSSEPKQQLGTGRLGGVPIPFSLVSKCLCQQATGTQGQAVRSTRRAC